MSTVSLAKEFYSLAEIADRWGVSHSSVLALVYSGDLRAVDVSTNPKRRSRYIVSREALEAFEESRTTDSPEQPAPHKRRVRVPKDGVIEFFS